MFTKNILLAGTSCGQLRKGVSKFPSIISKYIRPSYNTYDMELKNEIYHDMNMIYKTGMPHDKFICIGGDHSISIATGALSLNRHPDTKFIWIDAHADINSYEKSSTKNVHGMPLHFLSNQDQKNKQFSFIKENLDLNNLMYIGLRDIDDYEKEIIDKHKIKVIDSKSFNDDPEKCFHQITHFLNDSLFHLSFDVDCLDPIIMPCTGTKVENGLLKIQTQFVMKKLMKNKNLVNMDLTELNVSEKNMCKIDINKSLNNVMDIIF